MMLTVNNVDVEVRAGTPADSPVAIVELRRVAISLEFTHLQLYTSTRSQQ